METSEQAVGSQSSETTTTTEKKKPAAKKSVGKKTKKSAKASTSKRSPKKAAKRSPPAAKKVKAGKNPGGRPMLYPDKTILRLPKGSLKVINVKAKAAAKSQGEYLRGIIARYV